MNGDQHQRLRALVTGAARGQGAAEVRRLASEGADVIATDILDEEGEALSAEVGSCYRHLDATVPEEWSVLADWLRWRGQSVAGLVNNAGVPERSSFEEVSLEDWDRTIATNLTGPLLATCT